MTDIDKEERIAIGDRIRQLRERMDWNQTELGKKIGRPRARITGWETGEYWLSAKDLINVAVLFKVSPLWIMKGVEDMKPPPYIGTPMRSYPVLPWGVTEGESGERFFTAEKYDISCFAWRVSGDSMLNPWGAPSFADGVLILIDPKKEPKHRDCVIAISDGRHVFRQLVIEGDTQWLYPLNKQFDPILVTEKVPICGVIRASSVIFD